MKSQFQIKTKVLPDNASQQLIYSVEGDSVTVDSAGLATSRNIGKSTVKISPVGNPDVFTSVNFDVSLSSIERDSTIIDEFLALTPWKLASGAGTSRSADKVNTNNKQSIEILCENGAIGFMRNTEVNTYANDATGIDISMYVHDPATTQRVIVYLANDTGLSNNCSFVFEGYELKKGWNHLSAAIRSGKKVGAFDIKNAIQAIQIRVEAVAAQNAAVSFDALSFVDAGKANVLFMMDDGWTTQDTEAFRILSQHKLPATIGVVASNVGDARFISSERLAEIYEAGWDFANHTGGHKRQGDISEADSLADIKAGRDYLIGKGWDRAKDFLILPYGSMNDKTAEIAQEAGCTAMRTLVSGIEIENPVDNFGLKAFNLIPTVTISQAKAMVDNAIDCGATLTFLNHRFGSDTDTMFYPIDRYEQLAAYVASKKEAGELRCITASQWIEANKSKA
ncbi:polysaccharide deacetylase family protein [Listeria booriae]|uniref:Polysaccharide deacetylase family protein n=1 Tax=Listeria booriae TaxID=1552123 RepID=A0A841YPT8_9LIST|nr:polysaccharide deacetylase family protein [Listeria booriae]MBC1402143.1 polysaccharide deacetylase family protein [Listeria booriae]MBC1617875.1 polysaccharide deacetylase family protein [Listeria booriae]